jgi:uncharacterized protein (DUF1697 family)
MTTFLSLLRGINVGGNRKVKMDDLKTVYEALGLWDVVSYIQSGNVVFKSTDADTEHLQRRIEDGIENKFGFHVDVVIRTLDDLNTIVENNPFQNQPDKESKWVAVMLLAARPDISAQEALLSTYVGPEEIFFSGKEMYIYYVDGMGRSKLSHSFIEKKLKTTGTVRNWNTILKLQELLLH